MVEGGEKTVSLERYIYLDIRITANFAIEIKLINCEPHPVFIHPKCQSTIIAGPFKSAFNSRR